MDVLTDVAFGAPFGYLTRDEDVHDYIKTIRAFMPVLELQTNHSRINAIVGSPLVQAVTAPTAKDRTGMGKVIGLVKAPRALDNMGRLTSISLVLPEKLSHSVLETTR